MNTTALKRTSILLTTQVIVSAITLFTLYKFIYRTLGPANLGLWSLVLATTGIARFTDLGLSGSLGRFVARYRALNDTDHAIMVVETGVVSVFALLTVVGLLAFPLLRIALPHVIPRDKISVAFALLPYAVISLVISSVASAVQGAMDGCSRLDLRAILVMATNVAYVSLALWLSHSYGLLGLAWAQLIQAFSLALLGWVILRRILPGTPFFPHRWRKTAFREMIGYASAYQVAGIAMLLYEPVTKMLIAKFGGLSDVGIYEMASRVANQFRGLITAPQQSILPLSAAAKERGRDAVVRLYEASVSSMVVILLPTLAILIVSAPLISILWIGSLNRQFVHILVALALGVGLQTFIGPAYFTLLGVGSASWIAAGNVVIGIANLLYTMTLGYLYGTSGVIAGAVAALITGSAVIIIKLHTTYSVSWSVFAVSHNLYRLVLLAAALALEVNTEVSYISASPVAQKSLISALCVALLGIAMIIADLRYSFSNKESITQPTPKNDPPSSRQLPEDVSPC